MSVIEALKKEEIDEALDLIIDENFDPLEVDPKNGFTALHHSVELGEIEVVEALFEVESEDKKVDIAAKNLQGEVPNQPKIPKFVHFCSETNWL